ncbi:unnamed protein product [Cuscuta campestris]|uniref:Replication protein A OB domain-containing protein n=1 Tax=Cuscuta campestris TaxID=132261 RepID=A0A484ME06_9ASTE|nr:unnamed protein product [Cuscuta campestris]
MFVNDPPITKPVMGKETLIMEIILEDLEGTRIACTLWGRYASNLMKFVEKLPKQPVIAVIQFCKAGIYNGKGFL